VRPGADLDLPGVVEVLVVIAGVAVLCLRRPGANPELPGDVDLEDLGCE
jgi:hypothetical protein